MKVALVHDWLVSMRGGERCLEVLCELFPKADLFTLLHIPCSVSPLIERRSIHTSFVQDLPRAEAHYRYYLPLFPLAIQQFDFREYDLILSSSHCVAKGAQRRPGSLHISYTYSPMRYAWDLYHEYFDTWSLPLKSFAIPSIMAGMREWDRRACKNVDYFVAISRHIAGRIRRHYRREPDVIYPPVDTNRFVLGRKSDSYYLIVSAFVPYKRLDLAIQAFNALSFPLKIVGGGPEERRLRKLAGPTVEFLGQVSDAELVQLYADCRAVIFAGEEDFGIVPLEAHASGKPVIAYAKGGALETVVPMNGWHDSEADAAAQHSTGVYFYQQTPEALSQAVRWFEDHAHRFEPSQLRTHAARFDRAIFKQKIRAFVEEKWHSFQAGRCIESNGQRDFSSRPQVAMSSVTHRTSCTPLQIDW
jgi:glycosyltransferase involved in cell wall biosynthesis